MSNELQQEYIEEAKQVIKTLEEALLQCEGKVADTEVINNIYRYLHTLKGSAGMFGYHDVERLSHELEAVYADIRDGIRQQDDFILDLALHAVDVLVDLIDGKDAVKEADNIIKEIAALRQTGEGGEETAGDSKIVQGGMEQGFIVILRPEQQIYKRGINFQAIIEDLECLGKNEFIIHNERVPFEKQILEKDITSWFEIIVATTAGRENVNDVFMFMKESEYTVLEINSIDIFTSEAYKSLVTISEQDLAHRVDTLSRLLPTLMVEDNQFVEENSSRENVTIANDEDDLNNDSNIVRKSKKAGHVSVATKKLDQLINVVSELVIFRSEFQHLIGESENPTVVEAMEKLERLTLRLRDSAFNIRLVPFSILHSKLQRLIRSVSKELDKDIEFITEGLDTELDRSMINALEAPLMHLIRNAIDHGIENPKDRVKKNKPAKGLLKLYSYNSGDHVFIQLQDDGNGIDFDKVKAKGIEKGMLNKNQQYSEKELLNVMMTPGFSTAEKVTTVSGRGVGLDVVKKDIAAIRGDVEVSTEKGLGTIFTLRLPLTLTILDTLVVNVSENKYLIPITEIEHCYEEDHAKLFDKKSRQINYEGQLMPFVSMREYFGTEDFPAKETVIVINKNDTRIAVVVDKIIGKLQTVYKPLNELLHPVDCFSGASILGDGSMALILNALKLKDNALQNA
jgi:two-component system, chemotaxis family, sensor kinase CheA